MGNVTKCQHCGKVLHGRADKRFCNDDCRNSHNRAQKQAYKAGANKNIPAILKIIQSNYEILRREGPQDAESTNLITTARPEDIGIHTKFYTSIYTEADQTWYCCFDYGWRTYGTTGWEIRYLPLQAAIN